jgi:hypothetical protein
MQDLGDVTVCCLIQLLVGHIHLNKHLDRVSLFGRLLVYMGYSLLHFLIKVFTLQGFPPIATNPLGNTTISVAIGGYYCTEMVIWLQFVCLLQHKI